MVSPDFSRLTIGGVEECRMREGIILIHLLGRIKIGEVSLKMDRLFETRLRGRERNVGGNVGTDYPFTSF